MCLKNEGFHNYNILMPTNVKKNVMKPWSYETLTMEKPVVGSLSL